MKKKISLIMLLLCLFMAYLSGCSSEKISDTGACIHSWREETLFQPKTCNKCGATEGFSLLKHTNGLYANEISSADAVYNYKKSNDNSAARLDWYVNEASMNFLKIIAKELDVNGTYSSNINSADAVYNYKKTNDESAVRLDWYVNEASMNFLKIIAKELDINGTYSSNINSADAVYNYKKTNDNSAVRLDWYVNEASMNFLKIIANIIDE